MLYTGCPCKVLDVGLTNVK